MTEQNQRNTETQSSDRGQGAEHADTTFRELGGDPTVDPGATDTSIAGTTGADGGFVGEDAPNAGDTGMLTP